MAFICACPSLTSVTLPSSSTVAVAGVREDQVTVAPSIDVPLAETVAANLPALSDVYKSVLKFEGASMLTDVSTDVSPAFE
ncbi:MAG: hypothetical protein IJ197_05000 [Bacteroidaceae bacterium]|nr:hypothetical protein [Bacteroidaceae bacterium]